MPLFIIKMNYRKISNKLYEVEKIIARKIIRGRKYYLIKWKGYSVECCTWEPKSHLSNISEAVNFFDNNFPVSIKRKEYKQFMKLIRNYQKEKRLNKKKKYNINVKYENNNYKSTHIVFDLEKLIVPDTKDEEKKKEDEKSTMTENESQIEIEINIEKEKENKEGSNTSIKGSNIFRGTKLIKPILIW